MKTDMTLDDARLAARVARTLDRAAMLREEESEAFPIEAIMARATRPAHAPRLRQWSGGLALAASVAFMVALPAGWMDGAEVSPGGRASASASYAVDGQMLDEIDWLMAMEEAGHEAR